MIFTFWFFNSKGQGRGTRGGSAVGQVVRQLGGGGGDAPTTLVMIFAKYFAFSNFGNFYNEVT